MGTSTRTASRRKLKTAASLQRPSSTEVDHLDGKLIVDFMSRLKRDMVIRRFKKQAAAPPTEELTNCKRRLDAAHRVHGDARLFGADPLRARRCRPRDRRRLHAAATPAGRGMAERKSPVHVQAEKMGVPVFTPRNFRDPSDRARFAAHAADIAIVVAYGLILPQAVLDARARAV